jgi:3-methyladenine DNA glycosylase AlkD
MNATEVLEELESLGNERNRKIYPRHGVREPFFGVSYADLGKLEKRIKTNHALALELWKTRNHDARILATRIADPRRMKERELETWVKDLDNYVIADAFSGVVSASPHARMKANAWIASKSEWISAVGWNVLGRIALDPKAISSQELAPLVKAIEKRIHAAPNRTRHSMIMAMICIGSLSPKLRESVVAAMKRIGKVEIDHGETGCKTPDVVAYLDKMAAHRTKKAKTVR